MADKNVLAYLLVKIVDEFKGLKLADAAKLIEGTPFIGKVPVDSGMTNMKKPGQKLVGLNTENVEINEGLVRFDIVFYVRMRDGIAQIIVNIEVQKDKPTNYKILNRAIFYVSRLISSQKDRDFINSNYDDIKRVYTCFV